MSYTIAILEDVHNDQVFEFNKDGNGYTISLHNEATREYCSKRYKTIEEAREVYMMLVNAVMTGCYSFEQRKKFL